MTQAKQGAAARIIKKYPNRRLYDTSTSAYITLADVKQLVIKGTDFLVQDSKTKEDVTRSILLQIVLDEEGGGAPLFSDATLKQFIRVYGQAMQGHFGQYMEKSLQTFSEVQNVIQEQTRHMVERNPMLNPELMAKLMTGKAGHLPDSMGSYLSKSAQTFMEMQQQLQQQAQKLYGGMAGGGVPWFGAGPFSKAEDCNDKKK